MSDKLHQLLLTIIVISSLSFCGNNTNSKFELLPIEKIVDSLETLGYFKYADPAYIDTLKKEVLNGLKEDYLSTIFKEERPYNSIDYRHYDLDGETIYEEGGFVEKIEDMQEMFKKMNIKIKIDSHLEDWDEKK